MKFGSRNSADDDSRNEFARIRNISDFEKDDCESIKIINSANSKDSRNITFENCFRENWAELLDEKMNKMYCFTYLYIL